MKVFSKKIIYGCEGRPGDERHAEPYLIRYTLLETRWFQIAIHVFLRSDYDDLHDHPWPFVSLILWRGYIEETPKGDQTIRRKWLGVDQTNKSRKWPGMVLYRPAHWAHRVELVDGKAVTFVVMGKRRREWGFFVKGRWVFWKWYFTQNQC